MNDTLRKQIYTILILVSLGLIIGRIAAVDTLDKRGLQSYREKQIPKQLNEKRGRLEAAGLSNSEIETELEVTKGKLEKDALLCFPFFSANDRSRWCTIRALVEPDMRVPGAPYAIDIVRMEKGWDTIDMVKHDEHYYSSKPPLFPTLLAGVYWLIFHFTNLSFAANVHLVVKIMLILINVPMMWLFLHSVSRLIERFGSTDWGRIFAVATACFATFLSTFCVTLNNHLPGVMCVATATWLAVSMVFDSRFSYWKAFLLGLTAAFGVVNELPSLSFLAAIGCFTALYLPWKENLRKACGLLALGILGIFTTAAPFFATNIIAHDSFRPPYMHRSEGDDWYRYEYDTQNGKIVQSYWTEPKGIDVGEPSVAKYALHVLCGHHGIFSLTPVWIFSILGIFFMLREPDGRRRVFAAMVLALTLIVVGFYIFRPLADRNYGGMCCGFRWAFWLIPLWLCTMLPTLERMEKRALLRGLALIFLLLSAVSVAYPVSNPWIHPWLWGLWN